MDLSSSAAGPSGRRRVMLTHKLPNDAVISRIKITTKSKWDMYYMYRMKITLLDSSRSKTSQYKLTARKRTKELDMYFQTRYTTGAYADGDVLSCYDEVRKQFPAAKYLKTKGKKCYRPVYNGLDVTGEMCSGANARWK